MFNESGIVIIFYIQLRIDKGEANSKYFILIQKKKRFFKLDRRENEKVSIYCIFFGINYLAAD